MWEFTDYQQSRMLYDAGYPVLVLRSGELLVHRHHENRYSSYRLLSPNKNCDILESVEQHLKIIYECDDGRLMCLSPKGIVWLDPDESDQDGYSLGKQIDIDPQLPLVHFIGTTDSGLAFAASSKFGYRPHIVIVPQNQ